MGHAICCKPVWSGRERGDKPDCDFRVLFTVQGMKRWFLVAMRIPESPAWAVQFAANPPEACANHPSQAKKLRAIFGSSRPVRPRSSPQSKDLKRCFLFRLVPFVQGVLSGQRFEQLLFIRVFGGVGSSQQRFFYSCPLRRRKCVYVCICMYVYIYMYACMYICTHIYIHAYCICIPVEPQMGNFPDALQECKLADKS